MSESKFLKYQDKNGDLLSDQCDDLIEVQETSNCPNCKPNPNYVSPNWKAKDRNEPWFDEKNCKFQISIETNKTSLIPFSGSSEAQNEAYVAQIFSDHLQEASNYLLLGFNKIRSVNVSKKLEAALVNQKFYLDPRPNSLVKLLYSVSFEDFVLIPERQDDEALQDLTAEEIENSNNSSATGNLTVVTYTEHDFRKKFERVRRAIYTYSNSFKIYKSLGSGNLIFKNSDAIFDPSLYGDNLLGRKGLIYKMQMEIESFLSKKGLDLNIAEKIINRTTSSVKEIEFTFTSSKISTMKVYFDGCGDTPLKLGKEDLEPLNASNAFKSAVARGYFMQIHEMDRDLQARIPNSWIEFFIKFTKPRIKEVNNWPSKAITSDSNIATALSPLSQCLNARGMTLAQNLLDRDFSLADGLRIAFECKGNTNQIGTRAWGEQRARLGLLYDPQRQDPSYIRDLARVQKYMSIPIDDQSIAICGRDFNYEAVSNALGAAQEFREFLDRIKQDGLKEFLLESIRTVMGDLSLKDALPMIAAAALGAMGIEAYGRLYDLMGHNKRIDQKVRMYIEQNNDNFNFFRPWIKLREATGLVQDASSQNPGLSMETGELQIGLTPPQNKIRTLATKFDSERLEDTAANTAIIMEYFVDATIEVYIENGIEELIQILNQLPGAPLVAAFLVARNYPCSPLQNMDTMQNFIKDIDLPTFRDAQEITLPLLVDFNAWRPKKNDFTHLIMAMARHAIQKTLMSTLARLLAKCCEIIQKFPESTTLEKVDRCGEQNNFLSLLEVGFISPCTGERVNTDPRVVRDTAVELFQKLGAGTSALQNREGVLSFINDLSCSLTRGEMMQSFLGEMPPDAEHIVQGILENEYPELSDILSNNGSVKDFFKNMGDIFPLEFKSQMEDFVDNLEPLDSMPANPTLCATEEQLENFCTLRKHLLRDRASATQSDDMCEQNQADLLNDLRDMADALQSDPAADTVPQMISTPGCDDGLIPFETPEMQTTTMIVLSQKIEKLSKAFIVDMLGDGPLRSDYGMLNMILSDTLGTPLSKHYDRSARNPNYVDFYVDGGGPLGVDALQRGQFPYDVASWLQEKLIDLDATFTSNNEIREDVKTVRTYDQLGISLFGGAQKVNFPDFGYNTKIKIDSESQTVTFTRKARKKTPDLQYSFTDNNKGLVEFGQSSYSFGFNVNLFLSEFDQTTSEAYVVEDEGDAAIRTTTTNYFNIPSDNARINITALYNQNSSILPIQLPAFTAAQAASWIINNVSNAFSSPQQVRMYEFLATDDTLENLNLSLYPTFASCFSIKQDFLPQVVLLTEILEQKGEVGLSLKTEINSLYNDLNTTISNDFVNEVASNETLFLFGAKYDTLSTELAEYVVDNNQTDSPGGTLYGEAKINGELITEDDAILGISKDQFLNGNEARIIYLNPGNYPGTYTKPAIHVQPLRYDGWLGIVNNLFPESSACTPRSTDLINFNDIQEEMSNSYDSIAEDERLKTSSDCVVEIPYSKLLTRRGAVQIQGVVKSACRIFAGTHVIKALATFTKFKPDFDNVFGSTYPQFVVESMEKELKANKGSPAQQRNLFTDPDFWYKFLELSVQTYGRLVDEGKIMEPPASVMQALSALNDAQEAYVYPSREDFYRLRKAGQPLAKSVNTLKAYREAKRIAVVRSTEEHAKVVLKEMVKAELNVIGESLIENLKKTKSGVSIEPAINDLGYYFMQNYCQGALGLSLDKEIKEQVSELPTEGYGHYTYGTELSAPDGSAYVGYYHVHEDDAGNPVYMEGEFHIDEAHSTLVPFANKIIVPIGDVSDYGTTVTYDTTKPFSIEKYIKINSVKYSPQDALEIINQNNNSLNISDVYPGTLEHVMKSEASAVPIEPIDDEVVGLKGELGVRYGIELSLIGPTSEKYPFTSVEMDALDFSIAQFPTIEGNSKLLLCLLNMLKKDSNFKLLTEYIIPMKKILSCTAIYNDLGFLTSIGEKTVFPSALAGAIPGFVEQIPGVQVSINSDLEVDYTNTVGWAPMSDRVSQFTPLILTYDEWDQVLLRNSKSKIKKMFEQAYESSNSDFSETLKSGFSVGLHSDLSDNEDGRSTPPSLPERTKGALLENMSNQSANRVLPRFRRSDVVSNPFNVNGKLCEK